MRLFLKKQLRFFCSIDVISKETSTIKVAIKQNCVAEKQKSHIYGQFEEDKKGGYWTYNGQIDTITHLNFHQFSKKSDE